MAATPLKIALGDLRHSTIGKHSVYAPLGIGFLAAYLINCIPKNSIEVRMYDDPDEMLEDMDDWCPNVVGLANYCWNAELNSAIFSLVKKNSPEILTISGGPEFPPLNEERQAYLASRSQIDFYCPHEGEAPFAELMQKVLDGESIDSLRQSPQHGLVSLSPDARSLVSGPPVKRIKDLDTIPSPYVMGLMDQWLNGEYTPLIETSRGCPFSCTFCCQGVLSYNKLATVSPQHAGEEVRYIAEKLQQFPKIPLGICDSNFGMYPRDLEVATEVGQIMDEFNWPQGFTVTTGKTNHERILEVARILKNKMAINCATQSMDDSVLEKIKRKNLTPEQYKILREHTEAAGLSMIGEIIVPLPGETKETFFEGVKTICTVGIEFVNVYTTMMLMGTDLCSSETRAEYGLETRYRILPRQFGDYRGLKVFEIEEVCIATNTMSHDEYNVCRGLALVSTVFASEQYDAVRRILLELNIEFPDFLVALHTKIDNDKSGSSVKLIYNDYLDATLAELFPSFDALHMHYSKPENYENLLTGDAGDNLLRRFRAQMHLRAGNEFTRLTIDLIREMAGDRLEQIDSLALSALEEWLLSTRDLEPVFRQSGPPEEDEILNLEFDVAGWYQADGSSSLRNFNQQTSYRLFWSKEIIGDIISQSQKMYAGDIEHNAARIIVNGSLQNLWRSYDPIGVEEEARI